MQLKKNLSVPLIFTLVWLSESGCSETTDVPIAPSTAAEETCNGASYDGPLVAMPLTTDLKINNCNVEAIAIPQRCVERVPPLIAMISEDPEFSALVQAVSSQISGAGNILQIEATESIRLKVSLTLANMSRGNRAGRQIWLDQKGVHYTTAVRDEVCQSGPQALLNHHNEGFGFQMQQIYDWLRNRLAVWCYGPQPSLE